VSVIRRPPWRGRSPGHRGQHAVEQRTDVWPIGLVHGERDAVVPVPSALGWITLHASLPDGAAEGRVAIVLERAASRHATALRLETHGVTEREREVAVLLARGLTNLEIAVALVLSPYTVQDHIKSLFEKTDVSSRQELVARVFLDDYMPHIAARSALTSSGSFPTAALPGAC
jgi:DNA-binding CsgD family transcriptional regulator